MRVNEARRHVPPGGIDNTARRVTPGKLRTDGHDAPAIDDHVCGNSRGAGAVEHEPAGHEQIRRRALRGTRAAGAREAEEQQAEQPALDHAIRP